MRVHYLQHVWFEDCGMIQDWTQERGHVLTHTALFKGEALPACDEVDFLVIMGGPMNIYEESQYSWLVSEKNFIREYIKKRKPMIGICLGAQLIADVLGACVRKNPVTEIGWFPVRNAAPRESVWAQIFPKQFYAFHWHGDTFDIPRGAERIGETDVCQNQAFVYKENVIGLQFHLEMTTQGIQRICGECETEIRRNSTSIQSCEEIDTQLPAALPAQAIMRTLLDTVCAHTTGEV